MQAFECIVKLYHFVCVCVVSKYVGWIYECQDNEIGEANTCWRH